MHDPMVVAHEIPFPLPRRMKYREAHYKGRRWGFTRSLRTNPENLGEPVYRWWRPTGWTLALGGRVYGMRHLATIWHNEPKGRDMGEVCRHYVRRDDPRPSTWRIRLSPFLKAHPRREIPEDPAAGRAWISDNSWKWHVHHWSIQIGFLQGLRSRLFDRCTLCGRKGRPNVSHSWDSKRLGWHKFRSREGLYHHECSSLVSTRRTIASDETLIRHLFAALRVEFDIDERDLLAKLTDPKSRGLEFNEAYRLTHLLGYDRGESYELVKK